MDEPQGAVAQQPESLNRWILDAARRLSLAATSIDAIQDMDLDPGKLAEVWRESLAELRSANVQMIELLPAEPKAELR